MKMTIMLDRTSTKAMIVYIHLAKSWQAFSGTDDSWSIFPSNQ